MKIAVTGDTGFVGSNVMDLFKSKAEVTGMSRSSGFDLLDLKLQPQHEEALKNADFIVNFAADVGSIKYVTDNTADVITRNAQIILNFYGLLKELKTKAVVLNPIANCGFPGHLDLYREEDFWSGPVHPSVLSYGTTRRLLVSVSKCYELQYGIRTVNYYATNMYGEHDSDDPNKAHALNALVSKFIKAKYTGQKEVVIWGTGKPVREWLYARDLGRVFLETMERVSKGEKFGEAVNIGQKHGVSINELIAIIQPAVQYDGKIVYDTSMQDGAMIKVMDDALFRKRFPDFKYTSFEEGVMNTVKYYKDKLFPGK